MKFLSIVAKSTVLTLLSEYVHSLLAIVIVWRYAMCNKGFKRETKSYFISRRCWAAVVNMQGEQALSVLGTHHTDQEWK